MCANFQPAGDARALLSLFGVDLGSLVVKPDTYPMNDAPVIRNIVVRSGDATTPGRECIAARFGLLPRWAKAATVKDRRYTHNARAETIDTLASFKGAWRDRQFCLIPVEAFYENCYESGKPVRWRITLADGAPFALGGIWERWVHEGETIESFSIITVNADGNALLSRMHAPGDEKRMPVIVRPADYDRWLNATPAQAKALCAAFPDGEMQGEPAPRTKRAATPAPAPAAATSLDALF